MSMKRPAARPDTWMPMFWGDYMRDTSHLDARAHGAYLMLIAHYWCTGLPLADNDNELWRIARCNSKGEWQKLRDTLIKFFRVVEGLWHHKRVDEEIAFAQQRVDARRDAANARWSKQPPSNGHAMDDAMHVQSTANAHDNHNSQSQSSVEVRTSTGDSAVDVFEDDEALKVASFKIALAIKRRSAPTELMKLGMSWAEIYATLATAKTKADPGRYIAAVIRKRAVPEGQRPAILPMGPAGG